uniref:Aldehyde dehydrogenase domain-containing protein n=1 Tax=Ficedula albicollis TaxID=59894 RepID=U3JEM0_FICAL
METGTVFLQLPESEARRAPEGDGGNGSVDGDATRNPFAGLVSHLRASWLSGKTRPMEYRVAQLEALGRFLDDKKQQILEATASDLGKPPFETELSEIMLCKNELHETLNNLCHWMKDEHVNKNLAMQLDSAFIRKDPYGVVLIIAPWNYPIQLFLVPLIGAIAAGNCVIVKPSEVSKNTERFVAEALPGYLDKVGHSPHRCGMAGAPLHTLSCALCLTHTPCLVPCIAQLPSSMLSQSPSLPGCCWWGQMVTGGTFSHFLAGLLCCGDRGCSRDHQAAGEQV